MLSLLSSLACLAAGVAIWYGAFPLVMRILDVRR